jgi:hypothetical protein
MESEKLIRRRQEALAQKREKALDTVRDCELELDMLAGQLDQFVMPTLGDLTPSALDHLFGFGGRPRRRRISR